MTGLSVLDGIAVEAGASVDEVVEVERPVYSVEIVATDIK